MLIKSGKIRQILTNNDIQNAAFRGTVLTEKEMAVSAKIANFLRPFVQQRMDDNKLPEPHILTRAPLAALANAIATITGFPSLVRKLSITPQQNPRALHLTASGIYDTFRGQWDIPVDDSNWITSSHQAGKSKPATFGAFFNMNQVESLVDSYGLQFAWRLTFVNKWTVRLLGRAKPGKTFVKSNYESRRRGKTNVTRTVLTTEVPTLDRLNMEAQAEIIASQVKDLTSTLRSLRKELSQLELNRMDIGRKVRRSQWDPGSNDYRELKKIRQEISVKWLEAFKLEKVLARGRSSLYSLNKALRATNFTSATITSENASPPGEAKKKTLNGIRNEDYIEKVRFIQYYCLLI
jgi:hypothetical protein